MLVPQYMGFHNDYCRDPLPLRPKQAGILCMQMFSNPSQSLIILAPYEFSKFKPNTLSLNLDDARQRYTLSPNP